MACITYLEEFRHEMPKSVVSVFKPPQMFLLKGTDPVKFAHGSNHVLTSLSHLLILPY
jgi:hypothetical protein